MTKRSVFGLVCVLLAALVAQVATSRYVTKYARKCAQCSRYRWKARFKFTKTPRGLVRSTMFESKKGKNWFAGALGGRNSRRENETHLLQTLMSLNRQSPLSHGFAYAGTKKGKGYCGFGVYFRLLSMIAANTTTITMTAAAIAM